MKLILSILLITFNYLNAADFSIIIKTPFNSSFVDIEEDYDYTITAIGFTHNYSSQKTRKKYTNAFEYLDTQANLYGYKMKIVKLDNSGKILLSKSINLQEFTKAISLQKSNDNGYFAAGYSMDGEIIVVKLDNNGNILFKKKFGTSNIDKINSLVKLRDGGVLSAGSSFTSRNVNDDIFQTGLGKNDIFLTRLSKNGNIIWSKKYGTKYDDYAIDAIQADDGSLLLLSVSKHNTKKDIVLMRLDENGNKIWLKKIKTTRTTQAKKIIKLSNGNFLISLASFNNFSKAQIRLIKLDLYGNILKDKTILTEYSSILNDLQESRNGTIVGVGSVKDRLNTDALAMIFDKNLNLLKQQHFGNKNYDTFNALKILHNSQIIAAGEHTDNHSQETNMWILKLNSNLSVLKRSNNYKNIFIKNRIYKELNHIFKDEIDKKRVLIAKNLRITLLDQALYFKVAKYKLTPIQKQFLNKFSKKLISYLYKNRKNIKLLEINGHTSSEWKNSNFRQRYLKNNRLSLERAYETSSYIFNIENKKMQHFLSKILKSSGSSYKDAIFTNAAENKKLSRRVSFKILLK